jgi:phosphodiesterase/alkaline phosphatase D-like protein
VRAVAGCLTPLSMCGQGWGINPDFGGMKIYKAMRQTQPDFFIHCGDNIYADGSIQEFVTAENGQYTRICDQADQAAGAGGAGSLTQSAARPL